MPATKGQKYNIQPKTRIKKVFDKVVESGGSVSKAMTEVGYKPGHAKNPQKITKSKSWEKLLQTHLPDSLLAKSHKELLNQRRIEYFVFPKKMEDEEIMDHVTAAGLRTIVIRESDKGKLAFYSIADAQAKKFALEMAYKLKGKNPKEDPDSALDGEIKVLLIQVNNVINPKPNN